VAILILDRLKTQEKETMDRGDCFIKGTIQKKDPVARVKRQHTKWEKIFASCSSNRALISRIYKELKKLNTKRMSQSINGQMN
jgi:hypothetical protein